MNGRRAGAGVASRGVTARFERNMPRTSKP
jgi:hypothetical protein